MENAAARIGGCVAHLLRRHQLRFVDLRPWLREEFWRTDSIVDGRLA